MFEYHHTGVLVKSIEESIEIYRNIFNFSEVSDVFDIREQKVKVCFIKNSLNSYLELVEPNQGNDVLNKILSKGTSYYHIGYLVEDIDIAMSKIKDDTYLVSKFKSEAFEGRYCAFVYTKEMHLIELINK